MSAPLLSISSIKMSPMTSSSTGLARKRSTQRGVTLLELIIAISLVALISGGMLTAMRTSLLTNEKVTNRLRTNRERMNLRQMLVHQISGSIPVMASCAAMGGGGGDVPLFQGTLQTLRFVSSFSMTEGSRGYPQIVEYRVAPGPGGLSLVVSEIPYTGPASAAPFCGGGDVTSSATNESPIVAADHLARCEFSYQQPVQQLAFSDVQWVPEWGRPTFPTAVKIDMTPVEGVTEPLPPLSVTVSLRTDRDFRGVYADR